MKIIKKTTGLLIAAVFLFMLAPVNVFAANTILSISKSDIKAGDDFTVTISGTETSNLSLHYDGTMVTLKSQGNATLNGNILSINAKSASFAFTAKKSGSAGFVASSDKFARSSVRINIGEAADTTTADTNASTDDTKAADTSSDNTSDKTQTKDAATDDSSKSTDSTAASDTTAASDGAVSDSTSTSADVKDYPEISTSDFSLKELVLDRRITLIIGALLAVIIVLVIMLVWSHLSSLKDYDEDDESDDLTDDFDDEKINVKEQVEASSEKKPDFSDDEDETDKLYERLKEEEKLSMPKTPVVPEKKLHLEDLNNL
ncbi:MAG TPA: hypothetical protein DCQ87_01215 [Lachnospiraceae bacterium]|nr:hypothetical protein [Lachnospiraceae bacterium]MDD7665696.1 hypothetical protein [Lachnospiraceae bacterium]MDY4165213.1 hypothetical protein [Lachnospiraceae bacterium]HAP02661.1 hypothetical protein [Lachnospiraceae bacterium]